MNDKQANKCLNARKIYTVPDCRPTEPKGPHHCHHHSALEPILWFEIRPAKEIGLVSDASNFLSSAPTAPSKPVFQCWDEGGREAVTTSRLSCPDPSHLPRCLNIQIKRCDKSTWVWLLDWTLKEQALTIQKKIYVGALLFIIWCFIDITLHTFSQLYI